MSVSLSKGGNVSLTKEVLNLTKIKICLGWNARTTDGAPFDLDASVFLLGASGKVNSDQDFIFYNNKTSSDGSIVHQGDNRTGEGDGDDEVIEVNLPAVPSNIEKISATVTIHESEINGQNFGQVSSAYIRIVDATADSEIAKYDLSEDGSSETAMIFGEVYRHNGEWKFKAVGQGYAGGLKALAQNYGVNIA